MNNKKPLRTENLAVVLANHGLTESPGLRDAIVYGSRRDAINALQEEGLTRADAETVLVRSLRGMAGKAWHDETDHIELVA